MNNEPWNPNIEPQSSDNPQSEGSSVSQPQEQAQPAWTSTQTPQPGNRPSASKKKPKLVAAIIIAAVIALISGGGALAYNFWYQNPDKVITDALANSFSARTVKIDGEFNMDSADGAKGEVKFNAALDSESMAANFDLDVKVNSEDQESVNINASGVYADGSMFARLNNTSDVISMFMADEPRFDASSEAFSTLADKVNGKWIQVYDAESDAEVSEEYTCSMDAVESIDTERFSSEVADLYRDNRFVVVAERLGAKDIKGIASLGYTLEVDDEILEQFVDGLNRTTLGRELAKCSDEQPFELDGSDRDEASDDEAPTFNVWISRWSHELTRVEVFDEEAKLGLDFSYNEAVSVEAPKSSMSVEEFMEQLQSAMMAYYLDQFSNQQDNSQLFVSPESSSSSLFL